MKDTVTLKELFAIIVRRGKQVVCLMLAFALLLGIVQTGRKIAAAREEDNSPEKIEERYQDALENYQQNRENLEERLSKAQQQLEGQQEYNDNSLLLEIDPRLYYLPKGFIFILLNGLKLFRTLKAPLKSFMC